MLSPLHLMRHKDYWEDPLVIGPCLLIETLEARKVVRMDSYTTALGNLAVV